MLGYGAIGKEYPYELVHPLNDAGYITAAIGKNHFGFTSAYPDWSPVSHGYQYMKLYDGLHDGLPPNLHPENHEYGLEHQYSKKNSNPLDPEQMQDDPNCAASAYDDYDQWFHIFHSDSDPEATGGSNLNWNSWRGAPFVYTEYDHPTAWVAREAMQFIDDYVDSKSTNPFFLKISFHRPHSPYDPPQKYMDFVTENYDLSAIQHIVRGNKWDERFTDEKWCGDKFVDAWCGLMDEAETNYSRIAYHANVQFVDEMVGEIMTKLKTLGLYDDSYIIWTSDHGDQLGDHNLWRKTYPYNSNAKVPMIIKWNEGMELDSDRMIPRGSVDKKHPVELRDLLPTFHSVAGIELPSNWSTEWSGLDMNWIVKEGDRADWREWIDLEHSTCYNVTNHWNALADSQWKYIFNAYLDEESLFDQVNDPDEMNDLALDPRYIDVLEEWRDRMVEMFEKQGRGDGWVLNGTLQQRLEEQTHGPNFPNNPAVCQ